jgi:pheromone shutdown-related protein TraB
MQYKNLTLLGTSHIAKQSLDEVESTINSLKPDIVCIELDKKRLYSLTNKDQKRRINLKDIRKIGIKGFLFSVIGAYVEKKLGQYVGVEPGSEMLKAVELAKKNKIKLMVIDQDIEKTLKRFSQEFTWKEKGRIVADIFKAIIFRKKEIDFDLRTVPNKKTIKKLLDKVKSRYPNLYHVLITERNEYMASKLAKIIKVNEDKKVLAIIGAGHEEEMVDLIKDKKVDVIGHSYTYTIG